MSARSSYSPSPVIQQIANEFRRTGWISLWSQVVLVIISTIILIVAAAAIRAPVVNPALPGVAIPAAPNPSAGVGGFLTFGAIAVMGFTIYWAFRYVLIGRQLRRDAPARPKKSEVTQLIRLGLLGSLAGMLLGILGSFAIIGTVAVIAFRQGPGFVAASPTQAVNSLDILVVQASVNLILAHFLGLVGSLWLLYRMNRQG
ncbi:MAG: DUF3611 family protein [Leptolyngbyaceae cyanobacterium bins.349]|nr:DUF3611 family protein [Leptolyngbyaceae cyanobacterium bins.349]